jgi:hypothetical protein
MSIYFVETNFSKKSKNKFFIAKIYWIDIFDYTLFAKSYLTIQIIALNAKIQFELFLIALVAERFHILNFIKYCQFI